MRPLNDDDMVQVIRIPVTVVLRSVPRDDCLTGLSEFRIKLEPD